MHFRPFGQTGKHVSALGLGCMRFPVINDDMNVIDEPAATELIRHAIHKGINYLDTAYPYHGKSSETVLGHALQDGYREKITLATKMPCWLIEKYKDFSMYFDEQREKLQSDVLDVYLLHALWRDRWQKMKELDVFKWLDDAKKNGTIRYVGFSFHDNLEMFKEIVDAYDWDVCQIQYNILNENVQAGTEGLEYAAEKGLAVVVMEPLLGGSLANPPDAIQKIWNGADHVDSALRWLWNKSQVSVVISGMSSIEQVDKNIQSAKQAGPSRLSTMELDRIEQVQNAYAELASIPCTKCSYCMPCPHNVDIPRNFELYNMATVYDNPNLSKSLYSFHLSTEQKADTCIACRECESQCPQQIKISEWMPKVHNALQLSD